MISRSIATRIIILTAIECVNCNCTPPPTPAPAPAPTTNSIPSSSYPNPRRDDTVQDTYGNGVVIKDPYRWMENTDSPETKTFVQEEMAITKPYLEKSPFRAEITTRVKELYNYPRYRGPFQKGNKFFSYQNTGLQNYYALYIHDSYKDEGKIFIDPNTFSKDSTISMRDAIFSDDGSLVAYTTTVSDSDSLTIQIKNVEKGDIYPDKLTNVKFSEIAWTHDNKGLFYSAFPDQKGKSDGSDNKNHKLYYHMLGTEQSKDVIVAEFPENPDYLVSGKISDCGKFLVVLVQEGNDFYMIYLADLDKIKYEIKTKLELIPIVTKMEKKYSYITNNEKLFIFRTNKDADNYKIIAIDITNPDPKSWKDLVPVDDKRALPWASVASEKYLVLSYIEDVKTVLQLHETATGKMIKKFPLEIGAVDLEDFFGSKKYKDIFFNFVSFLTPGIAYRCDLSNPSFELEIVREIKVKNFDREKYTTAQVFFKSKDGTSIPMYIVHKKGLQKNGNNFTFMTAYGGFGLTKLPYFSVNRVLVMDNFDGVHAVPNVRGGGEYGEQWHRNGSLDKRQNSIDDFQAAAEYLISEKYTSSKLLAINGGSNGGILAGASLNQRPDLYGAVIIDVGVLDMLRFDKFTIGRVWVTEDGTPSKPEDFAYLIKYSPLHNIKLPTEADKQYPATLLTTSDHDDRVPPQHSFKFIAELQYQAKSHPNQKNPFIIKVDVNAGHGISESLDKIIGDLVDMTCFMVLNLGIQFHS